MAIISKIHRDSAGAALVFDHEYSLQGEKERINVLLKDETFLL